MRKLMFIVIILCSQVSLASSNYTKFSIDQKEVIGGSYNYSEDAKTKNQENMSLIRDKRLAKTYRNNWLSRERVSNLLDPIFNKNK